MAVQTKPRSATAPTAEREPVCHIIDNRDRPICGAEPLGVRPPHAASICAA